MSLGQAIENLQSAMHDAKSIDDGQVRSVLDQLIESVRLIGAEVEKLIHPLIVPGTDFGEPPCRCSVRAVGHHDDTVSYVITTNALCPVEGHYQENFNYMLDRVEESGHS